MTMQVADLLDGLADRLITADAKTAGRFLLKSDLRPAIYWMKARKSFQNIDKDDELTVVLHEWKADEPTFKGEMLGVTAGVITALKDDVFVDTDPLDVRPEQAEHWELLDVEPIKAAWRAALRQMGGKSASQSKTPSQVPVHKLDIEVQLKDVTDETVVLKASYKTFTVEKTIIRNMPFDSMRRRMQKWILGAGLELARTSLKEQRKNGKAESAMDTRPRNGELVEVLAIAGYGNSAIQLLAQTVKNWSENVNEDFELAAAMMADHVTAGAVLVPAPSSSGTNPACRILADKIADHSGCTMVEAVIRDKSRVPSHLRRRGLKEAVERGEDVIKVTDLSEQIDTMKRGAPVNGNIWLVDNVVTTGETMRAMAAILNAPCHGIVLARAGRGGKTYCKNGVKIVGSPLLDYAKQARDNPAVEPSLEEKPKPALKSIKPVAPITEQLPAKPQRRQVACVSASVVPGTVRPRK